MLLVSCMGWHMTSSPSLVLQQEITHPTGDPLDFLLVLGWEGGRGGGVGREVKRCCSAAGILHGMAHDLLTKPCLAAGNHTSYPCSSGFPLSSWGGGVGGGGGGEGWGGR